ncbi:MAG: formyltransferase family protein [Burkholderiaceae bacterium]|nr:formyltransferase family protein [Burkholderiaceae bacterium]
MKRGCVKARLRLAMLTSRGGGHCMHVAEQIDAGVICGVELVAVITENPGAAVIEKCRRRNVPVHVVPWLGASRRAEHERALLRILESLHVELIGLVGYLRLLGPEFVARFSGRLFNLHPSLLPAYPGLRAIERAFAAGETHFGATIHWVDEGCDTGAHIAQRSFERIPGETCASVTARVHKLEASLLTDTLNRLARLCGRLPEAEPTPCDCS